MSFLVLHMDKFKQEAVRGIQSHNLRERKSHSNPDIEYERSAGNYELHEGASQNYAGAVQNRIDDLLLTKAVRKDAVHLCGVIVSSDSEFFKDMSPRETRRFFEVCKEYLTMFVGEKNVISAMVHMDEKTPHMHFLHVPVTRDGRLNANGIYTRTSLKNLQSGLPEYLQLHRFDIQRGVEQEPGSRKKHLDTREFKQQQNALDGLRQETQAVDASLKQGKRRAADLQKRVQSYEQQAQDAEKELTVQSDIPPASMFNFKAALETASSIIENQKKALAEKSIVAAHNERLREETEALKQKIARLTAEKDAEIKRSNDAMLSWMKDYEKAAARLESINTFFRWDYEANKLHQNYVQQQRREAERKAAEQKRLEQERVQQERQRQEEKERQQAELARQEKERDAQRERERQEYLERRSRGMGMGR